MELKCTLRNVILQAGAALLTDALAGLDQQQLQLPAISLYPRCLLT